MPSDTLWRGLSPGFEIDRRRRKIFYQIAPHGARVKYQADQILSKAMRDRKLLK
jgi:hypothetical protein